LHVLRYCSLLDNKKGGSILEIDPILLVAAFAGGYLVSRWQCRYYWLINMALRSELIGMRRRVYCDKTSKTPPCKRKLSKRLPRMAWWAKAFIKTQLDISIHKKTDYSGNTGNITIQHGPI